MRMQQRGWITSGRFAAYLTLGVVLSGCTPEKDAEDKKEPAPSVKPVKWSSEQHELYFGIPVQVRFQPANADLARKVWTYLEHVDDVFNDYREDSEVGQLNATLTKKRTAKVSKEMAHVLRFAAKAHKKTDGGFDVTIGPLRDLWQRAARKEVFPDDTTIERTRARCGFDKVSLDGRTITTSVPGVRFDFGGCIKGWAVDRVVAILREGGAQAALVQVGGETAAFGISPRGRTHVLGIQHPVKMDRIYATVADPGSGLSAATSGNYRAPLVVGDRLLYHIFDPRTGQPADSKILSVSIVFRKTGRNAWADALSTAGAVLPSDKLMALAQREGAEALVLVRQGRSPDAKPGVPIHQEIPVTIREHATPGWSKLAGLGTQ